MKTNNSGLVATTLLVLAGFALTAPTPQNPISATVSDVDMRRWELPSNIKYLHLPQNVEVEINNGDGDGNTTVIKGSETDQETGPTRKAKVPSRNVNNAGEPLQRSRITEMAAVTVVFLLFL